jgi:hypothetical protein
MQQSSDVDHTTSMLDSAAQTSSIRAWMAAVPELASLRDLILTAGLDARRERTLCQQQEEHFMKMMDKFLELLDTANEQGSYLPHKNKLNDLSNDMRFSRQKLNTLRQKGTKLDDDVSSHMYTLNKLEDKVYQQVNSEWQPGLIGPIPSTLSPPTATAIHSESLHDIMSQNPRDELYSRMADLQILLNRLRDFEPNLKQELEEQDHIHATGQPHVFDNLAFFKESRAEYVKLQSQLEEVQEDVDRLKQICRQEGIEFHDVQLRSPFLQEAFYDNSFSTPSTQGEAATLPLPESPSGILGTFFATRERVKNWLKHPSHSSTQLIGAAESINKDGARCESRSDAGWVITRKGNWGPRDERPTSPWPSAGEEKAYGMPMQTSGPPLGSDLMEALLKESMNEPTKLKRNHSRRSHTTV